ncbi:hypothetical protein NBRC116493_02540 [Aurantivibrio infirmus]
MSTTKKISIWLASSALIAAIYLVGPFVMLPSMLSNYSKEQPSYFWSDLFSVIYTPFLNNLNKSGYYYITWQEFSLAQCKKHPGACTDADQSAN